MVRAYLSLGSNIEPRRYLAAAIAALRERFGELSVSPAYRSSAVGFAGADFINLAVGLETDLTPQALNAWLHALEDRNGRRRDVPRYSARTLDVDIVLYGDQVVHDGHLVIPRAELQLAFVLKPLADIAPDLVVPGETRTLAQRWAQHAQHAATSEMLQAESWSLA